MFTCLPITVVRLESWVLPLIKFFNRVKRESSSPGAQLYGTEGNEKSRFYRVSSRHGTVGWQQDGEVWQRIVPGQQKQPATMKNVRVYYMCLHFNPGV